MPAAIKWPKLDLNGPTHAGLAATSEASPGTAYALKIGQGNDTGARGIHAYASAKDMIRFTSDSDIQDIFLLAAVLTATHGWFIDTGNTVKQEMNLDQTTVDAYETEIKALSTDENIGRAATLLIATKANYWTTNHHTGVGVAVGIASKVIKQLFPNADEGDATKAMWIAGHWVDTKLVLWSAKVGGVKYAHHRAAKFPLPSSDMLKRFSSNPAGTAPLFTVCSILKRLATSIYVKVLPPFPEGIEIVNAASEVTASPASYHMGAQFLTGEARREVFIPSEESIAYVSAFIHAAAPASTLCHARSLLPKNEASNLPLYTLIHTLAAEIASFSADTDKIETMKQEIFAAGTDLSAYKLLNLTCNSCDPAYDPNGFAPIADRFRRDIGGEDEEANEEARSAHDTAAEAPTDPPPDIPEGPTTPIPRLIASPKRQ